MLGYWIIQSVGSECSGIKLHKVIENRDLVSPDTVVVHVGTDDLRRTRNLDYDMGDVYDLVNTARTAFSTSRFVLSGVLRRRGPSWRRIGAVNSRYDRVAEMLGDTVADPNSLVDDWDFGRDGLHINQRGARRLVQLCSRVCGIGGGRQRMMNE